MTSAKVLRQEDALRVQGRAGTSVVGVRKIRWGRWEGSGAAAVGLGRSFQATKDLDFASNKTEC